MKYVLVVFAVLIYSSVGAQNNEEVSVKQAIDNFFIAFHQKDSLALMQAVHKNIVLQRITSSNDGKSELKTEDYNGLVNSIISIPDSVKIHERLTSYSIQIDDSLAHAWTPYEFWINDELHHCGVNSFELFRDTSGWKIIFIIDTRRTADCNH